MAKGIKVTRSTRVMDDIRKAIPNNRRNLLVGIGASIEKDYRANAPRDTGSMAESPYTQLADEVYENGKRSSVAAVEARVYALNPDAEFTPLPKPTKLSAAYVGPSVGHSMVNEFGGHNMAARPTLTNAANRSRSNLDSEHKDLVIKLVTNGHR